MKNGYPVTQGVYDGNATQASIPFFAAGDVQDRLYRQTNSSAACGCQAARPQSR